MKIELDKFYTKPEVAKSCISMITNLESYDCIVEPSAGFGSFSNQLNCIAYDIEPEGENIIRQDFLALPNQELDQYKRILFIGNPPFGSRSSLAKQFIKKCISLNATTIAFILPDTFSKLTNQNCFPNNWNLILVHKLTNVCFIANSKDYHVPCSFYVWTRDPSNINLREIKMNIPNEFSFLSRGDMTADFTINGNTGKVKSVLEVTNAKAEHYIRVNNREDVIRIKEIFQNLTYDFKSSVNGGNAWIGQQDIIKAFVINQRKTQ